MTKIVQIGAGRHQLSSQYLEDAMRHGLRGANHRVGRRGHQLPRWGRWRGDSDDEGQREH